MGAGPGDPDHLTLRALRALVEADIVIHDRLVGPEVLALANPLARLIDVGKEGFGPLHPASRDQRLIVAHAATGRRVVRLKGGDCGIFGRLDEEIEALEAAGLGWSRRAGPDRGLGRDAAIGQSLTRRGRNASVRIVTGHDVAGFAEQDWRGMARAGRSRRDLHGQEIRPLRAGPPDDARRATRPRRSPSSRTPRARTSASLPTTLAHLPDALAAA